MAEQPALLITHVASLLIGHLLFALACVSSVLYLYQEHQIKTKMAHLLVHRFPSLSTLRNLSYRANVLGFIGLLLGVTLGIIYSSNTGSLNLLELRLLLPIFVCLMYAVFIIESHIHGYRKFTAIWSIVSFCMVLVSLGVEIYYLT